MMKEPSAPYQNRRNLLTQIQHKREVFWQITVPLTLGLLLILAAGTGVVLAAAGTGDVGRWADISIIWLIIPAMFFTFIFLALIAGVVYGVTWLLAALPQYLYVAQNFFILIKIRIAKIADSASEPILRIHQYIAGLSEGLDYIRRTLRR